MRPVQDGVALMLERAVEGSGRWFLGRASRAHGARTGGQDGGTAGSKKRTDDRYCKVALVACDERSRITYQEAQGAAASVEKRLRSRRSRTIRSGTENWTEATVSDEAADDKSRARCWEVAEATGKKRWMRDGNDLPGGSGVV